MEPIASMNTGSRSRPPRPAQSSRGDKGGPFSRTGSAGASTRAPTAARPAAVTVQISTDTGGARSSTSPMTTLPNT